MIEQLKDVAADVVGFRATGQITKEDFDNVLLPAVNALAERKGDIKYMLILDTDISNLTPGAWFDDIKMGLMHLLKWRKMAIVTDQPGVNKMTDMAAHILPGEVKSYTIAETEEAKKWLAL
ncbi:MAG: STAS/SEC14 domain-containing protein [Taibaiella sp.]|nr:STAS/SEC14 domain-containing protein [Taibaiella sp.]